MNATILAALLSATAAFYLGHRVADGACAKQELAAQVAATERYHAKEIELNAASTLLEESRAASAARAKVTAKQLQSIRNRPVYAGTCFDADGLRLINDALRNTPDPIEPSREVP